MAMNDSNKMPLLLAAGAIGGAVGYVLFTDSGKQFFNKMQRLRAEKTAGIPDQIEKARRFVETRGQNFTGRVRGAAERLKASVEAGQRAYEDAGLQVQTQVQSLHESNDQVVGNLHRAVDSLGKLFQSVQETMLDPLYEMGSIFRGLDRGVRHLASGKSTEASSFDEPFRRMG